MYSEKLLACYMLNIIHKVYVYMLFLLKHIFLNVCTDSTILNCQCHSHIYAQIMYMYV